MVNGRFQGPLPEGTTPEQEEQFRRTGGVIAVGGGGFQGPVPPDFSEEEFRRTGRTITIQQAQVEKQEREAEVRKLEQQRLIEQELLLAEQTKLQVKQRQFAGTISGQIERERSLDTIISPFKKEEAQLPFPSLKELGFKEDPFLKRLAGEIGRRRRSFFDVKTAEDLAKEVRGETGLFIGGGKIGESLIRVIPTGTIIDPSSGIREEITIKELVTQQAIAGGGAQVPAEFIAQDIGRVISRGAQEKLNIKVGEIQSRINKEDITFDEGVELLRKEQTKIQEQAQKDFRERLGSDPLLRKKGIAEKSLKEFRKLQRGPDISGLLVSGGIIAGSLVSPVVSGLLIGTLGTKIATKGLGKGILGEDLTISQRALAIGGGVAGLGLVALGTAGAFGTIQKQLVQQELLEGVKGLKQQGFKFGELRIDTPKGELSILRGARQFGTFRQEVDVVGRIIKQEGGRFIFPEGRAISRTTGILEKAIPITQKRQLALGFETFEIGAKGISFPLSGVEKTFGALGKGIIIPKAQTQIIIKTPAFRGDIISNLQENIRLGTGFRKDLFAGISRKVSPEFTITRGGRVERFIAEPDIVGILSKGGRDIASFKIPTTGKAFVEFTAKDFGVVRTLKGIPKTSFEVIGGGTGLPPATLTQLIQKPSGAGLITQQIIQKNLGTSLKPLSSGISTSIIKTTTKTIGVGGLVSGLKFDTSFLTKTRTGTRTDLGVLGRFGGRELTRVRKTPLLSAGFKQEQIISTRQLQQQLSGLRTRQPQISKLKQLQQFAPSFFPGISPSAGGFVSGFGSPFAFPLIRFPSFAPGRGRRVRRGRRARRRIRPSLSGILGTELFGFEKGTLPTTFKIGGLDIGILPGRIRRVPKKKKVTIKRKKIKKKIRRRKK